MKLKALRMKNFGKFSDFELKFRGDVTRLVGMNGSGKTTVGLTAIWACLRGIAERAKEGQLVGDRFRFIGNAGASADVELTIYDDKTSSEVVIKNHVTKSGNQITCEPVKDKKWLQELLAVAFLSAKNFTAMDGRQQALALGIDTSDYDEKIKKLKADFTFLNRQMASYDTPIAVEKTELVDITAKIREKDAVEEAFRMRCEEIRQANEAADTHNKNIETCKAKIKACETNIEECQKHILEQNEAIVKCDAWLNDNPTAPSVPAPEPPDTMALIEAISGAQEANKKADAYIKYCDDVGRVEEIKAGVEDNKAKQANVAAQRLEYIKSAKLGFDSLSVDDNGVLLLNNRPIREPYFSKGEIEIIVAKLYASKNPRLKTRFIDDFELLDDDNQEKILKTLLDAGFQIITAEVGKTSDDNNCIVLKECRIVDSYPEDSEKLI